MARIEVGDVVHHFKRELLTEEELKENPKQYMYEVKDFALNTETKEEMVVYKALYPPFETFVRPKEMFLSAVDKEKYPNIKQEYRLEVESIIDKVLTARYKYTEKTGNYPNKVILGYDYWRRIKQEFLKRNHMVNFNNILQDYDYKYMMLYDMKVSIDKFQPEILELGTVEEL